MYTYEEAYEETLKYFKGDDLATSVFLKKYALRDYEGNLLEKTPDDSLRRIAKEFARIEKNKFKEPMSFEEIYSYLKDFSKIVVQGSPMSGIGNDYTFQTLGNCFVIDSVEDSYGGIFYSDQQLGQLMKRRAGVGMDISNIRPKGVSVKNSAKTTDGIAVFMERYSNTCREVAQGGRRGALMISINVHHPEVLTFINIKKDLKRVTGANLSVKLTDDFLKSVENNEEYEQYWPIDKSKEKQISIKVKARDIWKEIINSAWSSGEPGVMFWDTMIGESLSNRYGEVNPAFFDKTTNPCITGDTKIFVADGRNIVTIEQLYKEFKEKNDFNVPVLTWDNKKNRIKVEKINVVLNQGEKDVYRVILDDGSYVDATEDHKFMLRTGEKKELKYLKEGTSLMPFYGGLINNKDIDVSLNNGERKFLTHLQGEYLFNKDLDKFGYSIKNISETYCIHHKNENHLDNRLDNLELKQFGIHSSQHIKKNNPMQTWWKTATIEEREIYHNNMSKSVSGFKNGNVNTVTNEEMFGIAIIETKNLNRKIKVSEWKEIAKKHNIPQGISKFREIELGNLKEFLHTSAIKANVITNHKIKKIEYLGKKQVYDLNIFNNHNFAIVTSVKTKDGTNNYSTNNIRKFSGLIIGNCGEVILGKDSCRLMITPLQSFVKEPFTDKAKFDFKGFGVIVEKAQRLMDDLIDLEIEAIEKIMKKIKNDPEPKNIKLSEYEMWEGFKETCIQGRRTGLGVNALADTLASLNIKYGSEESFEIVNEIFKTFAVHSLKSSCEMAKELGAFPIYSKELDEKYVNSFLQRIFEVSSEIKELHDKYGRRNISMTTCSPTGSISILTRTSSGIEPLFTLKPYTRRKKINPDDTNERVDFVDELGDKWQEYNVFHPYLEKWMNISGKEDTKESPYYGATSEDIDWEKSVKIQAIIQKWITHSISKTVNAPKNISKEVTERVYLTAWKDGCKGITFYRDGSRSGVLVLDNKKNEESILRSAPKRPKELQCEIFHVNVSKKLDKMRVFQYMVMIGVFEDKPYEIFAIENSNYDKKLNKGKIVKHARGQYDLVFEDGTIVKNITKETTENEDSLTRMVSLNLRHGVPIHFIVEQLSKVGGEMLCFAKSISRSLKKFVKDGTKSTESCMECNTKMEFENGCFICKNCGYSKCG